MVVDLDEKVVTALRILEEQATSRKMPLENYLDLIVGAGPIGPGPDELTMEEFDAILDELADSTASHPPLPADFSRADIYSDHD